jgi:biotin carboxyl carrier protein
MSSTGLKGKVGPFELTWKKAPRGPSGSTEIKLPDGKTVELRWKKDAEGIWIELPHGVFGYDISGHADDDGRTVYSLAQRQAPGNWAGLALMRAGEESAAAGAAAGPKKGMRVRAQMPGKIIAVSVKAGDVVEKDQPLLVMEAMKMENVIRAPQAGKLGQIKVQAGQAVETGADLCVIDPV